MARHVLTDEERRAGQFRSGGEAVEKGRKGGIASGEARRAPNLSSIAKKIAGAPITNKKNKKQILEVMGGNSDDEITNNAMIVMGVYMSAASGDIRAVEKWEEWTQDVEVEDSEDGLLEALSAAADLSPPDDVEMLPEEEDDHAEK